MRAIEFPDGSVRFEVGGEVLPSISAVRDPPPSSVKGSPISMECRLERIIPMGDYDHIVFGEVVRFNVRDDVYMEGGRIDTAALQAVGRLAAEYTLVHNAFTVPLGEDVLASLNGRRATRLDGHEDGFSPINQTCS